jgi:hypothetical protein
VKFETQVKEIFMKHVNSLILHLVLIAAFGMPVLAQDAPPKEAFRAVHLVSLKPSDVPALQGVIADMNEAVANAGYPTIRYRLYKVIGKQAGAHSYLWESSWPSGEVYDKVHNHPAWIASTRKHPELEALMKDEVYNRYVEVSAGKK